MIFKTVNKSCATCAHWDFAGAGADYGLCRLNPPDSRGLWPVTKEADVCGQWKKGRGNGEPGVRGA